MVGRYDVTGGPPESRGWRFNNRWTGEPYGRTVHYYLSNGMKAVEEEYENGVGVKWTRWNEDGSVDAQSRFHQSSPVTGRPAYELKRSPPWWWNVTGQTEPTAPWWDHEKNRAKE